MNRMKRTCGALVAALFLLLTAAIPVASADTVYEDGVYSAALTFTGGTGRIVWDSPVAVTVENGVLYADFTLSKPTGDLPSVEWMEYDGVRYTAQADQEAKTCVFRHVPVKDPAEMEVSANTTAMSEEHVIDYVLTLDVSAVPVSAAQSDPVKTDDSAPDGMSTVTTGESAEEPDDAVTAIDSDEPIEEEPADDLMTVGAETVGALPASGALSPAAVAAIVAGALAVLCGGAYGVIRAKKSRHDEK